MEHLTPIALGFLAGVVVTALGVFIIRYLQCGGDFAAARQAGAIAWRYQSDAKFAEAVQRVLNPPPPPPPKPWPDPLLLLTLMQREGRLIDFLLENVDGADNETLGAGVRTIHQACRKVLQEHLDLEPVIKSLEKATVEVPAGFDPSAIRVTGKVTGAPPFKGTLEHHGWRVVKIKLQQPAEGQDAFVLQPAEVELS